MPPKLTLSAAQAKFRAVGAEPLFEEFVGSQATYPFRCSCGAISSVLFSTLGRKPEGYQLTCSPCRTSRTSSASLEQSSLELSRLLSSHGLKYLGRESNSRSISFVCSCGRTQQESRDYLVDRLKRGDSSCSGCRQRKPLDNSAQAQAVWALLSKEVKVLSLPSQYLDNTTPIQYECPTCNLVTSRSWNSISKNPDKSFLSLDCLVCTTAKRSGKLSPQYNHSLTELERSYAKYGRRRAFPIWSKIVLALADYTCLVSQQRSGKLSAHHLDNWAKHPERRFLIENGVCLSKSVHQEFHHSLGGLRAPCTREQFEAAHPNLLSEFSKQHVLVDPLAQDTRSLLKSKKDALQNGIDLTYLYVTDWIRSPQLVLSVIRNRHGRTLEKYNARSLDVRPVSHSAASLFCTQNHLLGFSPSSEYLGLYLNSTLLSLMGFSRARTPEPNTVELSRFCSLSSTQIRGAASRLLSHYLRANRVTQVITYADLRISSLKPEDTLYHRLGFTPHPPSHPSYGWYKDGALYNRRLFQRKHLANRLPNFNPQLTERENCELAGYIQVWNCGHQKYTLDVSSDS